MMKQVLYTYPSSFKLQLIYKDSNSNPINLSGYCARLSWNTNLNQAQSFTTENSDYSTYKFEINTPTSDGKLTFFLPASTTNGFSFSSAKYDLELQTPSVYQQSFTLYIAHLDC